MRLDVPFGRMVSFLTKCAIAAIPAFLIVAVAIASANALLAVLVAGVTS
jgi:hypothetical protein